MSNNDMALYFSLSATAKAYICDRVVARLSADTYQCKDEDDALARVKAEIPTQIQYEKRQHRDDPLLPMPVGFHIQTCRCRALTYANDGTLVILNPITLTLHICPPVAMREPAEAADARRRHQQHERREGKKSMAATRKPRRIGIGGHHDNGV
jgi:hypothetical protein